MPFHHLHLTLAATMLAFATTSFASAAESSGIRLLYERMPTAITTDVKISTPSGESSTSGSSDLDSHMRVGIQMRALGDTQPFAMGMGWGLAFGQLRVPNPLGSIDHKYFELQLEPMISYAPIEQFSVEGGLGVGLGLTRGEMLVRKGDTTTSESSKFGFVYDAAIKVRPVYRPAKHLELFGQLSYTLLMHERLMYTLGDSNVSEVNSYRGLALGGGIGYVF